jgi:hypothetical protein
MLFAAVEPRRFQPCLNSGEALAAEEALLNVPAPPIPFAAFGRVTATAGGHQVRSQTAASVGTRPYMIECQHQQLTSLVMGATAIGALAPLVLD